MFFFLDFFNSGGTVSPAWLKSWKKSTPTNLINESYRIFICQSDVSFLRVSCQHYGCSVMLIKCYRFHEFTTPRVFTEIPGTSAEVTWKKAVVPSCFFLTYFHANNKKWRPLHQISLEYLACFFPCSMAKEKRDGIKRKNTFCMPALLFVCFFALSLPLQSALGPCARSFRPKIHGSQTCWTNIIPKDDNKKTWQTYRCVSKLGWPPQIGPQWFMLELETWTSISTNNPAIYS